MTQTNSRTTASHLSRLQLGVIKATALLVGLGIGLSAQAAPDSPSNRSEPGYEKSAPKDFHGKNRSEGKDQRCSPEERLDALHKQLSLTATQEALWNNAKAGTDKLRDEMANSHRSRQEAMKKQLESKTPDLRAITADMDRDQEARQQKLKAAREEWLKFYDALDGDQKQKASQFLLGQIGMMPGMAPRGRGHGPAEGPAK